MIVLRQSAPRAVHRLAVLPSQATHGFARFALQHLALAFFVLAVSGLVLFEV